MIPTDLAGAMWADAQRLEPDELDAVVDALIAEFADQLHASVVIEHAVLACQQLLAAGVHAGLGAATESVTRLRLRDVVPNGAPSRPLPREAGQDQAPESARKPAMPVAAGARRR